MQESEYVEIMLRWEEAANTFISDPTGGSHPFERSFRMNQAVTELKANFVSYVGSNSFEANAACLINACFNAFRMEGQVHEGVVDPWANCYCFQVNRRLDSMKIEILSSLVEEHRLLPDCQESMCAFGHFTLEQTGKWSAFASCIQLLLTPLEDEGLQMDASAELRWISLADKVLAWFAADGNDDYFLQDSILSLTGMLAVFNNVEAVKRLCNEYLEHPIEKIGAELQDTLDFLKRPPKTEDCEPRAHDAKRLELQSWFAKFSSVELKIPDPKYQSQNFEKLKLEHMQPGRQCYFLSFCNGVSLVLYSVGRIETTESTLKFPEFERIHLSYADEVRESYTFVDFLPGKGEAPWFRGIT